MLFNYRIFLNFLSIFILEPHYVNRIGKDKTTNPTVTISIRFFFFAKGICPPCSPPFHLPKEQLLTITTMLLHMYTYMILIK